MPNFSSFVIGKALGFSIIASMTIACTTTNVTQAAKAKTIDSKSYLSGGIWRADKCTNSGFFQAFNLKSKPPIVEVGSGILGEGEKLEVLSTSFVNGMIEVRTTVCAPIGCNKTWEQYKVLGKDKMQEWNFEGHLPNQAPNIVVKNGIAFDGSKGRVFIKCAS